MSFNFRQIANSIIQARGIDRKILEMADDCYESPVTKELLLLIKEKDQLANAIKAQSRKEIEILIGEILRQAIENTKKDYLISPGRKFLQVLKIALLINIEKENDRRAVNEEFSVESNHEMSLEAMTIINHDERYAAEQKNQDFIKWFKLLPGFPSKNDRYVYRCCNCFTTKTSFYKGVRRCDVCGVEIPAGTKPLYECRKYKKKVREARRVWGLSAIVFSGIVIGTITNKRNTTNISDTAHKEAINYIKTGTLERFAEILPLSTNDATYCRMIIEGGTCVNEDLMLIPFLQGYFSNPFCFRIKGQSEIVSCVNLDWKLLRSKLKLIIGDGEGDVPTTITTRRTDGSEEKMIMCQTPSPIDKLPRKYSDLKESERRYQTIATEDTSSVNGKLLYQNNSILAEGYRNAQFDEQRGIPYYKCQKTRLYLEKDENREYNFSSVMDSNGRLFNLRKSGDYYCDNKKAFTKRSEMLIIWSECYQDYIITDPRSGTETDMKARIESHYRNFAIFAVEPKAMTGQPSLG